MSYEKQTWQTGDTVTSAKLNHMEDGIAAGGSSGGLLVTITYGETSATLDKTYTEIKTAIEAGSAVWFVSSLDDVIEGVSAAFFVNISKQQVFPSGEKYAITLLFLSNDGSSWDTVTFEANAADGVLTFTHPGG